jgi:hypothetical protein
MPPWSARSARCRGWATSVSNRTILVTVRACTDDVIEGSQGERKIEGPQLFPFQRPSVEGKSAHASCVAETSETNAPRTMRTRARPPTNSQNTKYGPSNRVEGILHDRHDIPGRSTQEEASKIANTLPVAHAQLLS